MAAPKALSWLTYATHCEHVPFALILANSLRRTQTKYRIGVITTQRLPSKDRLSLEHAFDDIFYFPDSRNGGVHDTFEGGAGKCQEERQAKIFALCLEMFEKVVLLEPNSILLENCDHLFTAAQGQITSLMLNSGRKFPGDYFVLKPSKLLAWVFREMVGGTRNGSLKAVAFGDMLTKYVKEWTRNNSSRDYFKLEKIFKEEDAKLGNSVAQLSLKTGELLKRNTWALHKIVQLIQDDLCLPQQVEQVQALLNQSQLGVAERAILGFWLQMSSELRSTVPTMASRFQSEVGNEPIAIVGMSCRLPGANNLDEFWKLLYVGEEGVREPPQFRWKKEHVITRVEEKERQTRAGFLSVPVDEFDAKFFGVNRKEAEFMDPQTRLMHEVMWESLENAGVDPSSLRGNHTGIFTGSWMNDYKEILYCSAVEREFFRLYLGNSIGASAARLSFLLGTTGPCIATESGCSSAMVAVDMAVKSLRCGETKLALTGGVNLLLHPFSSKIMDYVISPDGRCKTFDAKADGFARAEGCGFLVLKRLSDAMKDRDHIWGLIRGSAVSQEGISKSLGTPTVHCEALAMELAMKDAGVRPEQVSFVETHGTGTAVGDPMEVAAIAKAYHAKYRKEPLIIGSVKTNVGHTESVSGITGIIKTVLAMKHELIPRHLNLETLNPEINLEGIPAKIPVESIAWPRVPGQTRFAGVSSFGITGTDGHVILEEAPDVELPTFTLGLERPLHILKISAKGSDALEQLLKKHHDVFRAADGKHNFPDVAYTGNVGRAEFDNRAFILANDFKTAADVLESNKLLRGQTMDKKRICFLFTGQGSQYPEMAKELYEGSPVFNFHFDLCDSLLKKEYSVDIRKVLWGEVADSKEISRTFYSQTGIFVVEYCLLQLWRSWGLKPDLVLGHSLGEFCAAVAAGMLSFEDALKLVAERSRLIDNLPRGSMLVLKASKPEVEKMMVEFDMHLDLAALNSKEQTVVAGDTDKVKQLLVNCKKEGVKVVILEASHAFHSHHMEPMLEEYRTTAEGIKYREATECQYISGMEGIVKKEMDADYWVRHTREKVNFLEACRTLKKFAVEFCLEVGPQPVLSTFVTQNVEQQVICLPSLRKGKNEWETMLTSLGKLWVAGFKVDWEEFDKPYCRKKVDMLPTYPFQRKSFWVEMHELPPPSIHPLIGAQLSNASNLSIYQNDLRVSTLPYLKDHCIGNRIVFPGAAFTEMCLAAGYAVSNCLKEKLEIPRQPLALENLRIEAPLELKDGKATRLQMIVDLPKKEDDGTIRNSQAFRCKVFHRQVTETDVGNNEKWIAHVTAEFIPVVSDAKKILQEKWDANRVQDLIKTKVSNNMEALYRRIDSVGLKFGEAFRSVHKDWSVAQEGFQADEVVTEVRMPANVDKYLLHPVIMDAMFQAHTLASARSSKSRALRVPVRVGRLVLFQKLPKMEAGNEVVYAHVRWTAKDQCTVFLCTHEFELVAMMEQVELLETNAKTIESVLETQKSPIPDCWEEQWRPLPGITDNRVVHAGVLESVTTSMEFHKQIASASTVTAEDYTQNDIVSRLVTLYAYRGLWQLGWRPEPGDTLNVEEFCSRFGVKTGYIQQLVYFYFCCFREELKLMEHGSAENSWRVCKVPIPTEEEISMELQLLHDKLLKVDKMVVVTQIYEHLAKHLQTLLTGEENPLAILFPMDSDLQHLSAENYYSHYPGLDDLVPKAGTAIQCTIRQIKLNVSNSDGKRVFRVLEVGAGYAAMSVVALKELNVTWGSKLEYYFTDISASFFTKAEKLLEEFRGQVKFAVFNIEEHPLPQGIPLNYFDLVLASDVLHATRDLAESVGNLRLTMRPSGYLLFTETVCMDKGITSVFGLLEGYWRFQDFEKRSHHPCVGLPTWKKVLEETGFRYVHTMEAYTGTFGIVTAEATELIGYDQWNKIDKSEQAKSEGKKRWVLFIPEQDQRAIWKVGEILRGTGAWVEEIHLSGMRSEETEVEAQVNEVLKPKEGKGVEGVIYAWGMENVESQSKVTIPFLQIAKYMVSVDKPPRLYLVTKNVHGVTEVENNPGAATLWGMAKSLKNENTDLFVRCVDLGGAGDWRMEVDQVLYELALCKATWENERLQVCYREGQRWEPRLNRVQILPRSKSDLQLPPSTDRYQLAFPQTRMINDLEFKALEEEPAGDGEVEIKCHAYALNFRDLFAILKPIKEFENIGGVGLDFAGVVSRVGPGVKKWKVGDRVFGVNFKDVPLPSHIVAKADRILKMPERSTFAEASTLPATFATSIHCLINIAEMKNGDTVLIHTGSGGVGLSAIKLARHVGAEIITTAGSPRKRAYLRSLGIEHVFHSRDTSYEQDILRVTNGRGVDVVLNSITGPGFKEATLTVCAKHARFVEMSKLSVWTPEEVRERRPDVQYWIADLTKLDHTEWIHLQDKAEEFIKDNCLEFIPFVKFDALRIRQALQYFQKAKHIGKVVVTMPEVKVEEGQWKVKVNLFNSDSTYLITGGLGGIGFEVCKWMLEKGATDIVLNGRNPPKPKVQAEIDRLNMIAGVSVKVLLGDMGDFNQCKRLISEITKSGQYKPLRGVHHCAGVLRDNLFGNQDWESFQATFTPKVDGTWNLHRLTNGLPLEHFVFYSSITALIGTPGQGNHAAANCFEDAFAHYRHSLGLPATSINWGQWAQVGCAKETNIAGLLPVSVERMLNALEEVMRSQKVQVCYADMESMETISLLVPTFKHYVDDKLLKSMTKSGASNSQMTLQSTKFWEEVDEAEDMRGKLEVVIRYIKTVLRIELRMEPDESIKDDANMQDLGVDSLMLIELRNNIQSLLGSRLTVSMNMFKDCQTIRQLATVIVNQIMGHAQTEEESVCFAPLSAEEFEKLLREDCQLEEEIRPMEGRSCVEAEKISVVLVTGATGQVGPYVLAALSRLENVKRIICLVRSREGVKPEEKLCRILKGMNLIEDVDTTKVECVRGDVVKNQFGLEEAQWVELSMEVDCVLHLAAKSNHIEAYRKVEGGNGGDIRSVNVGGTRNVIKFAIAGHAKSVFYTSALLACFGDGDEEDALSDTWPDLESAKAIAEAGILGYPASKYVSEMLLKQAVERGVPCKIFRLPWVMGDSKTGRLNFQSNHLILRFLTYLKLKVIPTAPVPALVLPVDICVDWSLNLFWNNQAPCGIYNVMHPSPQMETEFTKIAQNKFSLELEFVDWTSKEFVEKMYATEMPLEALKELYQHSEHFIEVGISNKFRAINGYINHPDRFFRNPKLAKYLPNFSEGLPSTVDILDKNLLFVKNAGYFKKFGI